MYWQDMKSREKEAAVFPFWKEGKSAGQIASVLKAPSRNAVISVFGRLRKVHGVRPATKSENGKVRSTIARVKREEPRAPKPLPLRAGKRFDPLPGTTPVPLMECGPRSCRWAVDGIYGPSRLFCAAETEPGSSYCRRHGLLSIDRLAA